jgi:hypothetical protein
MREELEKLLRRDESDMTPLELECYLLDKIYSEVMKEE